MDAKTIKVKLHELIENTDDKEILDNVYQQLATTKEDWYETLTQDQKFRLSESEEQYNKGEVVSNEIVLKKIQQWLQK